MECDLILLEQKENGSFFCYTDINDEEVMGYGEDPRDAIYMLKRQIEKKTSTRIGEISAKKWIVREVKEKKYFCVS